MTIQHKLTMAMSCSAAQHTQRKVRTLHTGSPEERKRMQTFSYIGTPCSSQYISLYPR